MSAVVALAARASLPVDVAWLEQATEHSRTAGPHGSGVWHEDAHGLGLALLRDGRAVESGPISLDGLVWLSADVRLDARGELLRSLRAAGVSVDDSCSDDALVLHAYAMWNEAFLDRLAGDFAFALWDGRARVLLCARDQLGIAPLHYTVDGTRLIAASVVDALLLHPDVSDALDESAIADFLAGGYYTDPAATAFAAIRQLPPGHVLTWADGVVRVRRYWQLDPWEPLARFARSEEAGEQLREILDVAVADRLTSTRATVQLSGGMDSTSLAASASAVFRARGAAPDALRAFTAVLGAETGDREGEFATLVAHELGLPADIVDGSVLADAADAFVTPEPTDYRPSAFALEYVRIPARHAPVALSGQGGDALLGFDPRYWVEWLARGRVTRVAHAFADQVRVSGGRPRPHLRSIVRSARGGVAVRERDARSLATEPMWATLFRLGDPSFTREPVRFRYPFFDLRVIRFVRSLPPEPWLVNKRVLRDSARGRLPDAVLRRPKTPLVRVASSIPSTAHDRLAEMVRACPELDRFLDRETLAASLGEAAAGEQHRQRELRWALGLAHWLSHRDRR